MSAGGTCTTRLNSRSADLKICSVFTNNTVVLVPFRRHANVREVTVPNPFVVRLGTVLLRDWVYFLVFTIHCKPTGSSRGSLISKPSVATYCRPWTGLSTFCSSSLSPS